MNDTPKKILILTADAGFGHRSAANAIANALLETYGDSCQIILSNPMDDKRTPFFVRDSQTDYDKIVRDMPELYRFGYDASDAALPAAIVESALTVMLFEVMRDLITTHQPDVVVTTYPIYQAPLRAVFTIHRYRIPLLTVVTDLVTVHRMWFSSGVDAILVPTEEVRTLAVHYGIKPEKIHITGIPVNTQIIHETRPKADIRKELGWNPNLLTILAVGSRRVEHLLDALNVINHIGTPLQLAVAVGKDKDLYQTLKTIKWHVPVHLYEYVDFVPKLMLASDLLICKAGGLIVTEALACKLPMILIDIIPGQETGNARYVVDGGAGELAQSPIELLETIAHWTMNHRKILTERARAAEKLSRPRAAYDIAELIWSTAKRKSEESNKQSKNRPHLIDLLTRFDITWQISSPEDDNKKDAQ
ncbi:MAG: hypothetical protein HPY45_12355 [Anaerolineae bacterium]|nr:hypothetical protein [Anaerolineae bacterium]